MAASCRRICEEVWTPRHPYLPCARAREVCDLSIPWSIDTGLIQRSLIGEHIDYALFGVFPAAVDRDILIACASRSDSSEIRSQNMDESKHTGQTFTASRINDVTGDGKDAWFLDIDKRSLRWESYVKAGYFVRRQH
jgi:Galactokinase galactose-binding signature